jgi:hypothetical protein
MYSSINSVCVFAFALLIGAGNGNTGRPPDKFVNEKMSPKLPVPQGDGIIGDWKLSLETFDENSNKKLDKEERNKATRKNYFYRFYPDGKCLINFAPRPEGAFKGHYEKKRDASNFERIIIYLDEGDAPGKESERFILSLTNDTLVLLNVSYEGTIWIFKRG